jgi:hypothetical protein
MSAPRKKTFAKRILRPILLAAAVGGLVCIAFVARAGTASASAFTVTSNNTFPISLTIAACGNVFTVSGDLHDLFHVTIDDTGGIHLDAHDNPQGISGSDSAGNKYQGTGVTLSTFNESAAIFPLNETFVNNFRMIGQGTAPNFDVHENFHVTVNADGTVTSFHDNFSIVCQ